MNQPPDKSSTPNVNTLTRFVIYGEPASKANSRRLVTQGGRPRLIKSQKALDYAQIAILQIPRKYRLGITQPVKLKAKIYYSSWRPDVDESIIMDVLQAAGVIKNDRQIRYKEIDGTEIDRLNPRAEIEITRIGPSA